MADAVGYLTTALVGLIVLTFLLVVAVLVCLGKIYLLFGELETVKALLLSYHRLTSDEVDAFAKVARRKLEQEEGWTSIPINLLRELVPGFSTMTTREVEDRLRETRWYKSRRPHAGR